MPFRDTQLGRYGHLCAQHFRFHVDPDLCAANALASDGMAEPPRPDLNAVLVSKLVLNPADPLCQSWQNRFKIRVTHYQAKGGHILSSYCTRAWPNTLPGFCIHEFTPPLHYWSLRKFADLMKGLSNILMREDGSMGVDLSIKPLYNYIITALGEILIGSEDFEWIKHTSLAAGLKVWSAGQIGIQNGQLRLVDLQSGHYITGLRGIVIGSVSARELIDFTESIIRDYCNIFGLKILHPLFNCIWV